MGVPETLFDEWDYDGVNENILADITVKGKPVKASSTSTVTASNTRSTA